MSKGIDIGNGYVKFDGIKFASKVEPGKPIGFGRGKKEVHSVKYYGKNYIVGEGAVFTGDDRYFKEYYKICLLTALALSHENEDFIEDEIVIGLPQKKHELLHEKLKSHIMDYGQQQIVVDEKEYSIRIIDCIIFIESTYPILTEEEGNILVIDMGLGTINVTQWKDLVIIKSATYNESMLKIYGEIASFLNSEKGAEFKPMGIEKIFNNKIISLNQKTIDITEIRDIASRYVAEFASYIRNGFEVKDVEKMYLIGGGGADTINYWLKEFNTIELVKNSQFVNSRIYDFVAKEEFGEK